MVHCCVPSCKNRSSNNNRKSLRTIDSKEKKRNVSFHCFPKDPITRNLWLDKLNIKVSLFPVGARICSDHFEEWCFNKSSVRATLKQDALPKCVWEETDASFLSNRTIIKSEIDLSDTSISDIVERNEEEYDEKEEEEEEEEEDVPVDPSIQDCKTIDYYQYKINNAIQNRLPVLTKRTNTNMSASAANGTTQPSTSTEDIAITLSHNEICNLKQTIAFMKKHYRHKIRNLQQNLRRKTKQIAKLKYALQQLKEKSSSRY